MAFDETAVARDNGGKFAEKNGWPPEVNLGDTPVELPAVSSDWKKYDGPDLREDGNLSNLMEFDHVIAVGDNGDVYDGVQHKHAPDCFNVDPYHRSIEGWELLSGYTGQHGYDGPWMHDSEQLGGRMAGDILERPGYYVAVYASYPDEDEPETGQTYEEGWAVAYRPFETQD
jgi:hypothetical protein